MVNVRFALHRRPVIRHVDHLPHLPQLDEQLRRIGWNNQQVWVRLDQDAGFFLVGLAQIVPCRHRFRNPLLKIGRVANAGAVAAHAAKVRQPVGFGRLQAIHRLGEHQGQRVFARTPRPGKNQRMGKPLRAHRLAQMRDRRRIAKKFLEAHESSLLHRAA